jgi:hypothetical protein
MYQVWGRPISAAAINFTHSSECICALIIDVRYVIRNFFLFSFCISLCERRGKRHTSFVSIVFVNLIQMLLFLFGFKTFVSASDKTGAEGGHEIEIRDDHGT